MRRWPLATTLAVAALSLIGAGAAAATVTFEQGVFSIGRGDVIAYAGKDALVEHPVVEYSVTAQGTSTCVYADGARLAVTWNSTGYWRWWAEARHAPGNGNITGYTWDIRNFTPDSMVWFTVRPCPERSSLVVRIENGPAVGSTRSLRFAGHEIPISYSDVP
jgi:hypothetical protein